MSTLIPNYSLLRHNTFGFDVRARFARVLESEADALAVLTDPQLASMPRLVLGGGSNVVLRGDFDGCALLIGIKGRRWVGEDANAWYVEIGAGENWHDSVAALLDEGRPGLENLALIPGTVGAAPIQNIGAYGLEMAERFAYVRALDLVRGEIVELDAAACAFGYRDSMFKRAGPGRFIILSVTFRLPKAWRAVAGYADVAQALSRNNISVPAPRDIFDAVVAIRRAKLPDPAVCGNAGSFFKNPLITAEAYAALKQREPELVGYPQSDGGVKLAAGWLIDRCGWKGHIEGAVAVHERQALVLVNRGGAVGTEVLALAEKIRHSVATRFGVRLEIEPVIV